MYILYPKYLHFTADPERHVQGVIIRHRDRQELLGNVEAVIGVEFDQSLHRLKGIVRSYLSKFPDVQDGKALVTDFKLVYCVERIVWDSGLMSTGIAGSPGRVGSEVRL